LRQQARRKAGSGDQSYQFGKKVLSRGIVAHSSLVFGKNQRPAKEAGIPM
jgi:hypothetical protein